LGLEEWGGIICGAWSGFVGGGKYLLGKWIQGGGSGIPRVSEWEEGYEVERVKTGGSGTRGLVEGWKVCIIGCIIDNCILDVIIL
jgi:hypothetical protein